MGEVKTLPGCVLQFTDETLKILGACRGHVAGKPYDLLIAHGTDGKHSGAADPHPFGKALDIRTHNLPDPEATRADLALLLGPSYSVILEDFGQPNEHIHAQYHRDLWPGTVPPAQLAAARALDEEARRARTANA